MTIVRVLMVTVALAMAAACGGDDGSTVATTCPAFTACGGDVKGTWSIAETCVEAAPADPDCPGATTSFKGVKVTGDFSYKPDMTYSKSLTVDGTGHMSMPLSCLQVGNSKITCAQLNAFAALAVADPDGPVAKVTCAQSGSACNCDITYRPTPQQTTGRWRTAGNRLIEREDDDDVDETMDYCVAGSDLTLRSVSGMAGMPGMDMMDLDPQVGYRLVRK